MRATDIRGFSEAYGSWKIICIFGRSGRSAERERPDTSTPSSRIDPDVDFTRPIAVLLEALESTTEVAPRVLFPHPDSPTRPTVSPDLTSSETPSTASTTPPRVG